MSAPHPDPGEREFDAMRRAQRAHEPSMDEILASIRAIIADDREGETPRASANRASNPAPHPTSDVTQISEANASPAKVEFLSQPDDAPAQEVASTQLGLEPTAAPAAERKGLSVVKVRSEIEPAIAAGPEPEREISLAPAGASDAPLLSEAADQAVTASFEALSSSLALQDAELLESLTREMLRPMIKTWLDENLPSLVERLVRAEIQRVARGGR